MLHFDTNALIALPHWARQRHPAVRRVVGGEAAATSAIVWYEFLIGPLASSEAEMARAFLQGRVVAIGEADVERAAALFNAVGRRRTLKTDALIASVAIGAGAEFVTVNRADFAPFVKFGLRLFSPRSA